MITSRDYRVAFFICLLCVSLYATAQREQKVTVHKAVYLGLDIAGPVSKIFEPGKTNFEASLSGGNFKNFQFTGEAGFLNFRMEADDSIKSYHYSSSGLYGRLGFDYNTFKKNLPGENNFIFFGIRYGFASLDHSAKDIIIRDVDWYDRYASFSEPGLFFHWLELTGGLRIQLYKNFGLGWTMRFKYMLSQGGDGEVKPYYIPGYGKGSNNLTLGFTYSVYYTFPLVKEVLE